MALTADSVASTVRFRSCSDPVRLYRVWSRFHRLTRQATCALWPGDAAWTAILDSHFSEVDCLIQITYRLSWFKLDYETKPEIRWPSCPVRVAMRCGIHRHLGDLNGPFDVVHRSSPLKARNQYIPEDRQPSGVIDVVRRATRSI